MHRDAPFFFSLPSILPVVTTAIGFFCLLFFLSTVGSADELPGGPSAGVSAAKGEKVYSVGRVHLVYQRPHLDHPYIEYLSGLMVSLGVSDQGFVAPSEAEQTKVVTIAGIADLEERRFAAAAIRHISTSVLAFLNSKGLVGVWVGPHPEDIDRVTGNDLRPGQKGSLRILIQTAVVGEVRSVARGTRFENAEVVNHPLHAWILSHSPVQPREEWGKSDLLDRGKLDDYTRFLSRHPGRRVDAAVSAYPEGPGRVTVDYLIHEEKPWTAWASVSNTGTDQTSEWRQTFGLQHTQLTGNDDLFDLTYSTASFDDLHSVGANYERPVSDERRSRLRLAAGWNEYTASDVGFDNFDFHGETFSADLAVVRNVFQHGSLFVDLSAGLAFERTNVDNEVAGISGEADFLLPHIGLELEQRTPLGYTLAELSLKHNVLDVGRGNLNALGRTAARDNFSMLSLQLAHSFYLDRLFSDVGGKTQATSLIHELVLSFNGQTAFGDRVPPRFQQTLGGLYSIRGYRESAVAGDTVGFASAEYRFHLPQVFGVNRDPEQTRLFGKPFRYVPQYPYGGTDWDLALKAFFDAGWAGVADKLDFENNEFLCGAGVGLDLRFKRNLFLTVVWAFALEDTEDESTKAGSSQVGISATFMY